MNRDSIDISNYEEWVIDRLDGKLSREESVMLDAFLLAHPELEMDIEELGEIALSPATDEFTMKADLKKKDGPSEEEIIAYVECEEMSPGIRQALDTEDGSVQKRIALYRSIVLEADQSILLSDKDELKFEDAVALQADDSIRFSDKEALKYAEDLILRPDQRIVYPYKEELKKREGGSVIPMYAVRWAVAASILLLAGLFILQRRGADYSPREGLVTFPSMNDKETEVDPFSAHVLTADARDTEAESEGETESLSSSRPDPPKYTRTEETAGSDENDQEESGNGLALETPISNEEKDVDEEQEATHSPLPPDAPEDGVAENDRPASMQEKPPLPTPEPDPLLGEDVAMNDQGADTISSAQDVDVRKERIPTVLEYLKEETAEELTGDKRQKIHALDVLQKVSEETEVIAMNSNHHDQEADRRKLSIRVGGFEFSRNKSRR